MNMFDEIATEYGGQTEKLKKGPKPYERQTVEGMCKDVISRINLSIVDLEAFNEFGDDEQFVSPMARAIRNGWQIKVGYGAKNEKLDGIEPMNFWTTDNAVAYLKHVRQVFEAGEGDEVLEAKLAYYGKKAQRARGKPEKEQPMAIAA
jgi:hypothetical protein